MAGWRRGWRQHLAKNIDTATLVGVASLCLANITIAAIQSVKPTRPHVGDVVVVSPESASLRPGTAHVVVHSSQGDCEIGTGALMDRGGSLFVFRVEEDGTVRADWQASGRSVSAGRDCGHKSEISMDPDDFLRLRAASEGWGSIPDPDSIPVSQGLR